MRLRARRARDLLSLIATCTPNCDLPTPSTNQNQTIEAFFFFDVAGNGVYDPAADPPASGISVSLVAPWLAHARQDGMVPLVTAVTNSSGYIVFVTDKIKPNDIVQIVDEEGNVLSSLLAGPDGVVPPGLYKAAVIMSYLTTAARSKVKH